jgi:pimeloyl-ACP methyl ester carboxylesterase
MTTNTWLDRLQRFPLHEIATPSGRVAYRQAGGTHTPGAAAANHITHVLLHGIGSSSANWLAQLEAASLHSAGRVLAWDAPGYGKSDALPVDAPTAAHYAQRVWAWLDAVLAAQGIEQRSTPSPVILVGHSLGCLMAASAAVQQPQRIQRLVLLAPAQGYARAQAAERDKKLQDRLDILSRLGPAGMAQLRGAAMLAPHADADKVALVQHIMAQIDPHGYTQAARMLAGGDLLSDLSLLASCDVAGQPACPVVVASGSADTITPPAGCQQAAAHINAPYVSLGAVGHACAIEAAEEVTQLIGLAAPAPASPVPAAAPAIPVAKATP